MTNWTEQHQEALSEKLDAFLDVEAGLREVLLQSRYDAGVEGMDAVVDVEAGLRDILPSARQAPMADAETIAQDEDEDGDEDEESGAETASGLSAGDRMRLRGDPEVRSSVRALQLSLAINRGLHAPLVSFDWRRRVETMLTCVEDSFLLLELAAGAHAKPQDFAQRILGRLHEVSERLRGLHPLAQQSTNFAGASYTEGLLSRVLGQSMRAARILLVPSSAATKQQYFSTINFRTIEADLRATRHLLISGALPPWIQRVPRGRNRAALEVSAEDLTASCTGAARRAIRAVDQRLAGMPLHTEDHLRTLLDDFTRADLRGVDLSGVDLEGVRWSEHGTLWPSTVDVEELKSRSQRESGSTSVYIVRTGLTAWQDIGS